MARERVPRRRRPVYPAVEIVTDDHFDIEEGTGSVSLGKGTRLMRVPLIDTPGARHVRAHEMAHARYSPVLPRIPEDIQDVAMQRAEDMRMNRYCRTTGLHEAMDAPMLTRREMMEQLVEGPLAGGDKLGAATAACATYKTGDYPKVINAIRRVDRKFASQVARYIPKLWDYMSETEDPTFGRAVAAARAIQEFVEDPETDPEPQPQDGDEQEDSPDDSQEGKGEGKGKPTDLTGDPMDRIVDRGMEEAAEKMAAMAKLDPVERGVEEMRDRMSAFDDIGKVAKMTVVKRPLTERLPASKLKGRQKIAADCGRVPRYMGRYCSDRAVFVGSGKRRGGGAIIIDCSGSMNLVDSHIDQILTECPAGIIATYSSTEESDHTTGELWIIAANGKRVKSDARARRGTDGSLRPSGLGNVVDYPALQWLAKQGGEKYWVCDGLVTGQGDQPGTTELCADVCLKAGIIKVTNISDLIKAIRGEKY